MSASGLASNWRLSPSKGGFCVRTVIEEQRVSDKIDSETSIYPRLEEAYEALTWWLSHQPESGEILDDEHLIYKQAGNRGLKLPALVALYTYDAHRVEIISILVRIPTL
jgi:hypothetical protein